MEHRESTFRVLETAAALAPGCSLWLIPDVASSRWSEQLDWHLNFQIMKAERHASRPMSPEIARILADENADFPPLSKIPSDAPLMLASGAHLPSSRTVVVPFRGDVSAWLRACHLVWKNLKCPPARLFLPDSVEADTLVSWLSSQWLNGSSIGSLELVAPQSHLPH